MSRRAFRIVALALLAAVVLSAIGVLGWDWVADYRLYRRAVTALTPPGQEPAGSLEEFLRVRRALAFYDEAERLAERNSTAEEVRTELGEPDQVEEIDGYYAWFYSGPMFRGHQSETIVMRIDVETSLVTSIGYIHHN